MQIAINNFKKVYIDKIIKMAQSLSDLCSSSGVGFGIFLLEDPKCCVSAIGSLSLEEIGHIIEVIADTLSVEELNYLIAIINLQRQQRIAAMN